MRRFECCLTVDGRPDMRRCDQGEWVNYKDLLALRSERDRLLALVKRGASIPKGSTMYDIDCFSEDCRKELGK